ncbi:MAG: ParB/RepB/Spo0J family partition protein [Candidatus Krumholzibacteriota bacterium]|nr:ParB/RepB/Spo0J family partition protein [Candidatus Krumholzibacteriota bacterium]
MRKRVLGRGLDALISPDMRESVSETERIIEIEIDRIDPNPHQPRNAFDDGHLRELADSIGRFGVLQPVVVRRSGDRYQLVVGERRFRASRLAGKTTIPAIVRRIEDDDSLKLALLENLQREDLNPIEEARGYQALQDEHGLTAREIADILGKDRSTVSNTLRLLKLPDEVVGMLADGKLTAGHARAILAVEGAERQIELARRVVEEGITVREVERERPRKTRRGRKRAPIDPQLRAVEERLEMRLGTRVRVTPRRRGGIVSIEYYSDEELERLLEAMGVDTTF